MPELIHYTANPVGLIAACARVSRNSFARATPENNAHLVNRLIELGHLSALEFARATFYMPASVNSDWDILRIVANSHGWALSAFGDFYLTLNARTIYELLDQENEFVAQLAALLPGAWRGLLNGIVAVPAPLVSAKGAYGKNIYVLDVYNPRVPKQVWGRHAYITAEFRGISRVAANQIVRHRIASYMQESQRYCHATKNGVKIPQGVLSAGCGGVFYSAVAYTESAYARLIEAGVAKEDARFIYPMGAKTNLVASMSVEMWRHFIELRTRPSAQWEIRELAQDMSCVIEDVVKGEL